MGIEKPISTIRKAIQNFAEEKALKESLDTPKSRHFEDAFNAYKAMRIFEPDKLEQAIKIRAREQDIKNEMGNLYNIFQAVWVDVNKESKREIDKAIEQIKANKKMSINDIDQSIDEFELKFIKEKAIEVKNDPRIVSAFSGKEEILNEGLYGVMLSMLHILRKNRGNT